MVAASANRRRRTLPPVIPVVDLSLERHLASQAVAKACEKIGFFKVINHGVQPAVSARLEAAGMEFFALPTAEKQTAGPPDPLGYGCRKIGLNGDIGDVEYLLLPTDECSVYKRAEVICIKDPDKFRFLCDKHSCVVIEYVEAMKKLAREILELIEDGLELRGAGALCRLIEGSGSDSLLRLNYYPSQCGSSSTSISNGRKDHHESKNRGSLSKRKGRKTMRIGFGEHTDPQILSLLRCNGIGGLQILVPVSRDTGNRMEWVTVPPDPAAVFINVGDALQVVTNRRLVSVRHRATTNSRRSRLSMIYFAAPQLHTQITPLPEMITAENPQHYKGFTWAEYKKIIYSLKLGQDRLDCFKINTQKEDNAKVSNQ